MNLALKQLAKFDAVPRIGELRLFADLPEPVTALVVEDRGAFGFRVIPVSPYTAPSCEGESEHGGRVYQLWNLASVPRSFALRSWRVAELAAAETAKLARAAAELPRVRKYDDYRREQLFSAPSIAERTLADAGGRRSWLTAETFAWSVAAGLAVALMFAVHLDLRRASRDRVDLGRAWTIVQVPPEPVELIECESSVESMPTVEEPVVAVVELPPSELPPLEPSVSGPVVAPSVPSGVSPLRQAVAELRPEDAAYLRTLALATDEERAIAVISYCVFGVRAATPEFGLLLERSANELVARRGAFRGEYAQRLAATALASAWMATDNPELKISAEQVLTALGDHRAAAAVATGFPLLEEWFARQRTRQPVSSGYAAPMPYPEWYRRLPR